MIQALPFWLALVLGVPLFWRLPDHWRLPGLALLSAAVLATVAPWVVVGLSAWTAAFVLLLRRPGWRKAAFIAFVVGLLVQLALFKYLPPLLPELFGTVLVPLGLSFFTFKLMHYGIEVMRGNIDHARDQHRVWDVLAWVLLFPIFSAGPIERFDHFMAERETTWKRSSTVEGLTRIAVGLVKRFVLAELVLGDLYKSMDAADLVTRLPTLQALELWLWLARSFLRLYLDFSGYCDIAIGAALLFGCRIVENFDRPLLAPSPAAFWQRWHISLARWCSTYVYMPALGLTRQPYVAVFATFLVMGLWHAGSAHWVAWGLWQATGVSLTMMLARAARKRRWQWHKQGLLRWPLQVVTTAGTLVFMFAAQSFSALHGVAPIDSSLQLLRRIFLLGA